MDAGLRGLAGWCEPAQAFCPRCDTADGYVVHGDKHGDLVFALAGRCPFRPFLVGLVRPDRRHWPAGGIAQSGTGAFFEHEGDGIKGRVGPRSLPAQCSSVNSRSASAQRVKLPSISLRKAEPPRGSRLSLAAFLIAWVSTMTAEKPARRLGHWHEIQVCVELPPIAATAPDAWRHVYGAQVGEHLDAWGDLARSDR